MFATQHNFTVCLMLQQVTQEANRVLTRFNERQTTQQTTAHSRSYHCQRSSLEPTRTRAQNSKGSTFTKPRQSVKNRFHHRPAGRNKRSDTQHHATAIEEDGLEASFSDLVRFVKDEALVVNSFYGRIFKERHHRREAKVSMHSTAVEVLKDYENVSKCS